MKKLNVLSLFDGISCGKVALKQAGIEINHYFASEIDTHAIQISKGNHNDIIQIGDVTKIKTENRKLLVNGKLYKIDVLIGGFPCQAFSFSGKQGNFNDPRGKLFFECVRLLKELNPTFFLFENVKMKSEFQDFISSQIGVEPILINSNLLSAQNRQRLYWTNIPNISQPQDKQLYWNTIQLNNAENVYYVTPKMANWINKDEIRSKKFKVYHNEEKTKMQMIEASHSKGISNQRCFSINDNEKLRFIHVFECELLQNLPFNKTDTSINFNEKLAKKIIQSMESNSVFKSILKELPASTLNKYKQIIDSNDPAIILEGNTIIFDIKQLERMNLHSNINQYNLKIETFEESEIDPNFIQKFLSLNNIQLSKQNLKSLQIIIYLYSKEKLINSKKILQISFIDGYTNHASNTQRYKSIGNGWTVNTISHIFKNIK